MGLTKMENRSIVTALYVRNNNMAILRLIDKLQNLKDLYGNVIVEWRNPAGDFDETREVQVVNTSSKTIINYRIFLDA